jgi:hypothetical protein
LVVSSVVFLASGWVPQVLLGVVLPAVQVGTLSLAKEQQFWSAFSGVKLFEPVSVEQ